MNDSTTSAAQKALAINLGASHYGTFAEIGGGQEVARWFFLVGGAAGTVAKTTSAYDMSVSDQIYGHVSRYVSRKRLETMLELEFAQLRQALSESRGDAKRFFVFADTVATRSYSKGGNGRGWLGVRFQTQPGAEPSQVIIHAQLRDTTSAREQEALGVLGVNLVYGALVRFDDPHAIIDGLLDELSRERVEIDMIKFSGPAFEGLDQRLMSLQLVERNLTDAAMFRADGETVQPADAMYKRPILVERGSFRPPTKLTVDLLQSALRAFKHEPEVQGKDPLVIAEMTLRSLASERQLSHSDFLARADLLRALGIDVLISRFEPYYQLAQYLSAYTDQLIGLAVGLPAVQQIADEKFYTDLAGGVLESIGRLFQRNVRMYVYPTRDPQSNQIHSVRQGPLLAPWHHLRALLLDLGKVVPIEGYDPALLSIHTPDVLERIVRRDASWQDLVPESVEMTIRSEELFGYQDQPHSPPASVVQYGRESAPFSASTF